MALKYQPKEKAVVMCDFSGFIAPEMVKTRPVVVISKHKKNSELVTIVPLSTTKPEPLGPITTQCLITRYLIKAIFNVGLNVIWFIQYHYQD
ncbi:type II toxin-antitoxin system PemK/MazF family toxin [Glaesserella parasuis]|uniref:type II toxin-antitoxin system PemK/MazF family toxin n=1 Tax=Glaesserella parasuis TaxID=738 RepID=UPI003853AC66